MTTTLKTTLLIALFLLGKGLSLIAQPLGGSGPVTDYLQDINRAQRINSKSYYTLTELPKETYLGNTEIINLAEYSKKHIKSQKSEGFIILNRPDLESVSSCYMLNAYEAKGETSIYVFYVLQYHYLDKTETERVIVDANFDQHLDPNKDIITTPGEVVKLKYRNLNIDLSIEVPSVYSSNKTLNYHFVLDKEKLNNYEKSRELDAFVRNNRLITGFVGVDYTVMYLGKSSFTTFSDFLEQNIDWKFNGGGIGVNLGMLIKKQILLFTRYSTARVEPAEYTVTLKTEFSNTVENNRTSRALPWYISSGGLGIGYRIKVNHTLSIEPSVEYLRVWYPRSTFDNYISNSSGYSPRVKFDLTLSPRISPYIGVGATFYQYDLTKSGADFFHDTNQSATFIKSNQYNIIVNFGVSYAF